MKPTAQQPRFYKFRKYQVPQYIKDALDALKPPDDITVSQWAEQYRQLSRKESNLQGAWRNSVTPYLVGIMDEFNNWETERIVVVKPTQVGGTEAELNALGYLIDQDPAPTLIVYPNDEIAESTSANRIMSMLESPRLKRHFLKNASSKKELQLTTDIINERKTRICKLSDTYRHLQIQYSLTASGRLIRKINPKAVTRERRRLKAYKRLLDAGRMAYSKIEESFKSWIASVYKYMSRQQIQGLSRLFYDLFGKAPTWKKTHGSSHGRLRWMMALPSAA